MENNPTGPESQEKPVPLPVDNRDMDQAPISRPTPLIEAPGGTARISESIAGPFHQLKEQWYTATAFVSSGTEIINHPAHQQIINLGPSVVPLIIEELRQGKSHWFYALHKLTDYSPPEKYRGNMGKMRTAWLEWADEHMPNVGGTTAGAG